MSGQERELAVDGFLTPERSNAEDKFVLHNWEDAKQKHGVANFLMAEHCGDMLPHELGYERQLIAGDPCSGEDMVVRALPCMSFATVIDNPIPKNSGTGELITPLSHSNDSLPFEDDHNAAFSRILRELNCTVSTPNGTNCGKADVVITFAGDKTCALESIMASVPGQVSAHLFAFSFCF